MAEAPSVVAPSAASTTEMPGSLSAPSASARVAAGTLPSSCARCLRREHGGALHRRGADLHHHMPWLQRGGAGEITVLPEPQHVAHDHGASDRVSNLDMAPHQHGVDIRQRLVHAPIERAHRVLRDPRRQQDRRQEPTGPGAHDRNVVRVHQHRMGADILPGQRHRVAGGDQGAPLHGDDARVLAHRRRQQQLGRHGPARHQHLGQQFRRQLPDLENFVAHPTGLTRLAATDGIGSGM